jgi:diacylglycerol O-acyltransferase / wax synthase
MQEISDRRAKDRRSRVPNPSAMADRLTSLDGSFLRVETPNVHMHVAWSGLFEPRAGGRRPTVEALRAKVAARLGRVPRFRQRLAYPPLRLAEPSWVDDPAFDVAAHITELGDPDIPVALERFADFTDATLSQPLDRERPLWQVYLVPRLADGRAGLVFKMHHALVDGKSAVELALLLFDLEPDPEPEPAEDWLPARSPSAARLALGALAGNAAEPLRAARGMARLAGTTRDGGLTGTLRRAALAFEQDLLRSAPASYLNGPIGPSRVLVRHRARMSDLVEAKRRAGVTLNDVCLAAVAGALRNLASLRGERPRPLKVMVPVSVRGESERRELGNRISFAFIELPVAVRSRAERLQQIHRATSAFKTSGRPAGTGALLGAIGLLPDPVKNRAARVASSARVYNLTISNIPGPRQPLYMLGAELVEAYPVVPLGAEHALSVGMFSYRDHLFFGLYADPEALPEVRELPTFLNAEILALSGPRSRPGRARDANGRPAPAPRAAASQLRPCS